MSADLPPVKPLRLRLDINAFDREHLVKILEEFALAVDVGRVGLDGIGCSSSGWTYRAEWPKHAIADPDEYDRQLLDWHERTKHAKRGESR